MGVIEASDRAWKGVQMTDERHGAAEWLRGIIGRYKDEADGFSRGCSAMAKMFGIDCKEETCRDCMIKMMTAIADRIDAERALPEGMEWPRFEDGEPVRIGDELEFEGKTMLVCDATLYADDWALWCDREDMSGRLYGKYGERVKRPAPKVLDADGVPIKVDDTVYFVDGDARPLHRGAHRCQRRGTCGRPRVRRADTPLAFSEPGEADPRASRQLAPVGRGPRHGRQGRRGRQGRDDAPREGAREGR